MSLRLEIERAGHQGIWCWSVHEMHIILGKGILGNARFGSRTT